MPKLHQLIAVIGSKKSDATSILTTVHQRVMKGELLQGLSRVYRPKDEEGDKYPPESKKIQYTVEAAIDDIRPVLQKLYDAVAAQDATNCIAKADVVVNGTGVLTGVPSTHLLFLEKQLIDLCTFIDKLPALDPTENWTYDTDKACYTSELTETTKTKKIPRVLVKAEATDKHPAQTEVWHEDVPTGNWQQTKFSGALPETEKRDMLNRAKDLLAAVRMAREEANRVDVIELKTGAAVLDFVFGKK